MRGRLNLFIEIDYENMIRENYLEALHAFTGKSTVEELQKLHMDMIGEALTEIVKDKPHMAFHIEGQFVPTQKTWGDVKEEVEKLEPVDELIENIEELKKLDEKIKTNPYRVRTTVGDNYDVEDLTKVNSSSTNIDSNITVTANNQSTNDSISPVELLDEDIEEVSMTLGMPQLIKINDTMKEALENNFGQHLNHADTNNGVLTAYKGFPVATEAMEELYIIEYKTYTGNEVKTYSKTI